jgi:hypothetical protein
MEDGMGYLVLLFDNMKVMHLPTFQEYSSRNGCGQNYCHNFKGKAGKYQESLVRSYFAYCNLLDNYSQLYLLDCDYFDIEIATNQINAYERVQQQKIDRTKLRKKK